MPPGKRTLRGYMTVWANSKMTTLFYSADEASENYSCIVDIDSKRILVKYMENGVRIQYEGTNFGDGHFHLHSHQTKGHATLHRHPARDDTHIGDSDILEGSWSEASYRGMWRIKLVSASPAETADVLSKEWEGWA